MIRPCLALIVAAASAAALASGTGAAAEAPGGGALADALHVFARRAHVSILFRPEIVSGLKPADRARPARPIVSPRAGSPGAPAPAVSPEATLAAMLRGTGLVARRIAPRTYVIERSLQPPLQSPIARSPARAALPEPPAPIVVTALRRPTLLLETPLSMVAIDGQEWRDLGGRSNADVAKLAPSLALSPAGAGLDRMSMRGVFSAGEPSVGLYYGTMPVSGPSGSTSDPGMMTPNLLLADVDRIEVLRGPQGTLYGAGSLAGTVRILFRQPDLDRNGGSAEASLSSTRGGGEGFDTQAVANLVLEPGRLAVRAVAYRRREAGFADNEALGLSNIGRRDDTGGRISLKWQPVEDW